MSGGRARWIAATAGLVLVGAGVGAGVHGTVVRHHDEAVAAAESAVADLASAAVALDDAVARGGLAAADGAVVADAIDPLPSRLAGLVGEAERLALVEALAVLDAELARVDATEVPDAPQIVEVDPDTDAAALDALAAQALAATPAVARSAAIVDSSARRLERSTTAAVDALRAAAATAIDTASATVDANPRAGQDLRDALTAAAEAFAALASTP